MHLPDMLSRLGYCGAQEVMAKDLGEYFQKLHPNEVYALQGGMPEQLRSRLVARLEAAGGPGELHALYQAEWEKGITYGTWRDKEECAEWSRTLEMYDLVCVAENEEVPIARRTRSSQGAQEAGHGASCAPGSDLGNP